MENIKDKEFEKEIEKLVMEIRLAQEKQVVGQREIYIPKPEQKPEKNEPSEIKKTRKNSSFVKPIVVFMILILVISIVSIIFYINLDNSYSQAITEKEALDVQLSQTRNEFNTSEQQLIGLEDKLVQYQGFLDENNSQMIDLKSGDEYNLHDPLRSEVMSFLEEYNEADIKLIISDFKNQGIRCAYVNVGFKDNWMKELIGFNTLDYGMVYMEPYTRYLVTPVVGLNYYDCVNDQPYGASLPEDNDEIAEILIIW